VRRIVSLAAALLMLGGSRAHAQSAAPAADSTYELSAVDKQPEMRNRVEMADLAAHSFPAGAASSGTVTFRYVVDEHGRVDPATITVEFATDPAFVEPGRQVVARMRFTPARIHGRAVRVFVTSPVAFMRPEPKSEG
jgi:hypothetical protein